jgi:hypothetical protein
MHHGHQMEFYLKIRRPNTPKHHTWTAKWGQLSITKSNIFVILQCNLTSSQSKRQVGCKLTLEKMNPEHYGLHQLQGW